MTEVSTVSITQQNGMMISTFEKTSNVDIDYIETHQVVYLSVERVGVMRTYELSTKDEKDLSRPDPLAVLPESHTARLTCCVILSERG